MSARKIIELDLRTGIPEVRKQLDGLVKKIGACRYTAPCVIGAMMTPAERCRLRVNGDNESNIGWLITDGKVAVPSGQKDDFSALQMAFDDKEDPSRFSRTFEKIAAKYEQAA